MNADLCLQSRDAQLSNALGKPLIINDLDCDVERLSLDDFEDHHSLEVRLFAIEQARLADICTSLSSQAPAILSRSSCPFLSLILFSPCPSF